MELARPRLAVLGLLMVVLAYFIAQPSPFDPRVFGWLLVGSSLSLAGASMLNQVLEHRADARMKRTANRPLPAGRMPLGRARAYGVAVSGIGFVVLALGVNAVTALCAVAGWAIYLFAYTPLKPRTSLNTVVGAIPGSVPVLMGWAAARGELAPEAWLLFGILFLWQLPHFLAIAWMYRVDYERAGFRMLPVEAPDGASTARQVVGACLALVPVSLLPTLVYLAGPVYFWGALALGLAYLAYGFRMGRERTGGAAKRLLRMSVVYLPALFVLLALDRGLSGL